MGGNKESGNCKWGCWWLLCSVGLYDKFIIFKECGVVVGGWIMLLIM